MYYAEDWARVCFTRGKAAGKARFPHLRLRADIGIGPTLPPTSRAQATGGGVVCFDNARQTHDTPASAAWEQVRSGDPFTTLFGSPVLAAYGVAAVAPYTPLYQGARAARALYRLNR